MNLFQTCLSVSRYNKGLDAYPNILRVSYDGIKDFVIEAPGGGPLSGTYVVHGSPTVPGSAFDSLGNAQNDSFADAGQSKSYAGGAGNDTFTLDAASVAYGGAGNDVFTIGAGMLQALANPLGLGGNLS